MQVTLPMHDAPSTPENTNETCSDAVDNDSDGQVDCDDPDCGEQLACQEEHAHGDADGDGFSPADGDCQDSDPAINPGASEVCDNGVDDNCDGSVDEGCGKRSLSWRTRRCNV